MDKKDTAIIVVLLVLVLAMPVAGYLYQPYWVMDEMVDDYRHGDIESINRRIDFPALRATLKSQLREKVISESDGNPLALALGLPMFEVMIDAGIRAETLPAVIASGQLLPKEKLDDATKKAKLELEDARMRFVGIRDFLVESNDVALLWQFRDFKWQLVDIRFGADAGAAALAQRGKERVEPEASFNEEKLSDVPLPKEVAPGELEDAIDLFRRQAFLAATFNDTAKVEFDVFHLPNADSAEFSIDWQSAIDATGKNRLDTGREPGNIHVFPGSPQISQNVPILSGESEIVSVAGTMTVALPVKMNNATFGVDEVGSEKPLGDYRVELKEVNGSSIRIILHGFQDIDLLNTVELVALNEAGKRLDDGMAMRSPDVDMSVIMKARETGEKPELGDRMRLVQEVHGVPAKILVFMPEERIERTFTFTAKPEPDVFGKDPSEILIDSTRYAESVKRPVFRSMNVDSLRKEVKPNARRLYAMFGFNDVRLEMSYPEAANSRFARSKWTEVQALDTAGNPPAGLDADGNQVTSTVDGEPPRFAVLRGIVEITYPVEMRTISLQQETEPGINLGKNHIAVDADEWEVARPRMAHESVRAFDAQGRPLRYLRKSTGFGNEPDRYWFWGEISRAEVDVIEEKVTFEKPFELNEPEPLPESRRGQAP